MIDAATQFYDFAVLNDQLSDAMVAQCLIAFGLHDIGAFRAAEEHLRYVLARYSRSDGTRDAQRYLFNYRALALSWLASVEWRTGRHDDAARTAALAVAEAGHHVPSLFVALSHAACPIALDRSDWRAATRYIDEINRHCGHHIRWRRWADALSAILAIQRDNAREALYRLDDLLSDKGIQFPGQHFWYAVKLIDAHLAFGHDARAGFLADILTDDIREREEYWLLPEVNRVMSAVGGGPSSLSEFGQVLELEERQVMLLDDIGFAVRSCAATGLAALQALRAGSLRRDARTVDSWSATLFAYPRSGSARQRVA
jgi:hypothetical protein